MPKITIAVDGYSSTGKSTVAKQLADWLEYVYVDTGAMYRAVTLYAMEHGMIEGGTLNSSKLIAALPKINLEFKKQGNQRTAIHLNGKNVDQDIRHLHVSEYVSPVATISEVRKKLVRQQQQMGAGKGVVMDGRDIGTVVFPDAELKIFMTASAQQRAERRYQELLEQIGRASCRERV